MTNLEWLEQVVKARTPGPWNPLYGPNTVVGRDSVAGHNSLMISSWASSKDTEFIALMGTISEQLVAVVRAVKYWEDYYAIELAHYKNGETQVLCDAMAKLDTAITAARNGMESSS